MKGFFTALLLLPFLFAAAQDADDCPPGTELVQLENGEWRCRSTTIVCLGGDERQYTDIPSGAHLCCLPGNPLVIYDKDTRQGVCCGAEQVYAGTPPNGKCCPKGQILKDGECVPAPPPSTCQGCPAQPPGACQLKTACGDSTNNGLQFGKCYQLHLPNGKQLGRGVGAAVDQYTQDGFIQNIPYKVCKTTDDCGTGAVKATDNFFVQDLIGPSDGSKAAGWGSEKGGAHMQLTTDVKAAGVFNGKTSCSSCKCVVQLTSLGYACPFDNPGMTFWPNPKVTMKLQFLEIPCDGKFNF
ncbi:hypothetical protein V5O48_004229 [Marasmius crinis-equi]|uniref:Uncharacterized protein n=1 Tax=Marasmius crinis-equi TaxID=585013 RepID=A0ABR3FQP7_9AGAR